MNKKYFRHWKEQNIQYSPAPPSLLTVLILLLVFLTTVSISVLVVLKALNRAPVAHAEPLALYGPEMPLPDPCELDSVVCEDELNERVVQASAYTSTVGQTDDTPCISADGSDICKRHANGEHICAANFVPLGTLLTIESNATSITRCVVADRMNRRYQNNVDLYFGQGDEAYKSALQFGRRNITIKY